MKSLILSLWLCLYSIYSFAQTSTYAEKIAALTFRSTIEKDYVHQYLIYNQLDTIGLLLTLNTKLTTQNVKEVNRMIDDFAAYLTLNGSKKRKNLKKFIEFVFQETHSKFFKLYKNNISFDRIFTDGTYNCLTASALYALLFERLNIRYQIKETPEHVYLVADPEHLAIMVESTQPNAGYFVPDEKFKKSFVNELVKNKIITSDDVLNEGVERIFVARFYNSNPITLPQLIGLQYSNAALAYSQMEEMPKAWQEIEKAYYIYPCERTKHLRRLFYASILEEQNHLPKTVEELKFMLKFLEIDSSVRVQYALIADFQHIAEHQLIKSNNIVRYDSMFNLVNNAVVDSLAKLKLLEVHYASNARRAELQKEYEKTFDYSRKILKLSPSNLEYQGATIYYFTSLYVEKINTIQDIEKMSQMLDSLLAESPILKSHPNYTFLKNVKHTSRLTIALDKQDFTTLISILDTFEEAMIADKEEKIDEYLGNIYMEIIRNWVRVYRYDLVENWITRFTSKYPVISKKYPQLEAYKKEIKQYHLNGSGNIPPPPPEPKKKKKN